MSRNLKQPGTLRPRSPMQRVLRYWQLYLMLLIPVAAVFIFHYIPIYGIQIAFRKYSPKLGYWGSEWVGLKYFKEFLTYPKCWQIIWNTVKINLLNLLTFPCPIVLAILFNDLKNGWFKKTTQMITYAPHFISTVVLCSMVLLFTNCETGVLNTIIELFGGERSDIMGKSENFAPVFVLSGLWQNLGWDTVIYLAALSSLSPELLDAAKVDGANRWRIVWNIYIPHLLPTIIIMFLLGLGDMVSVGFEKVFLLQNPLNLDASTVLSTYVYNKGLVDGQLSYSTADGLFQSLVAIALVSVFNAISKKVSDTSLW